VKTGVKAGSVAIVEDIVLLRDGLSVRMRIGIVRWAKFDETRKGSLANMVVVRGQSCSEIA